MCKSKVSGNIRIRIRSGIIQLKLKNTSIRPIRVITAEIR